MAEAGTKSRALATSLDYYEQLGLTRACTDLDVRKGFRRLALKVRTDEDTAEVLRSSGMRLCASAGMRVCMHTHASPLVGPMPTRYRRLVPHAC